MAKQNPHRRRGASAKPDDGRSGSTSAAALLSGGIVAPGHLATPAEARLVSAALNVRGAGALDAGELAFVARILAQATLPHSDPGDVREFGRTNGALRLVVQPGPGVGVPYGSYPRLVMAWLTTEAVRTGKPRIVLGDSLSAFMRELGIVPTGGRWGTITRLRDQMRRLFAARIAAVYDGDDGFSLRSMEVATDVDLWWSPHAPGQAAVFESVVVLGDRFFQAVTERPVPVDMRVLRALKKSPLGLDLYTWLTYRVSYLRSPVAVTWASLHDQFGAEYADPKNFARKVRRELAKIRLLWPELRAETPPGRLVLKPSPTHVEKRAPSERTAAPRLLDEATGAPSPTDPAAVSRRGKPR